VLRADPVDQLSPGPPPPGVARRDEQNRNDQSGGAKGKQAGDGWPEIAQRHRRQVREEKVPFRLALPRERHEGTKAD